MLFKKTMAIRLFGFLKIPLIFYVRPQVIRLDARVAEIKIPLRRRVQNHVKSMHFSALALGVDLAAGVMVLEAIKASKANVSFIFKDFSANFLKLAKSDVHFVCEAGDEISSAIRETIRTGDRVNVTVPVIAKTPRVTGDEPIATFTITVSVKAKSRNGSKAA